MKGYASVFKVGLELFATAGPRVVAQLTERGHGVFLDLKLHDIPNTVAHAVRQVVPLGCQILNIHMAGGRDMARAAVEAAREAAIKASLPAPRLLGVTVLTSISEDTLRDELLSRLGLVQTVQHFAELAQTSGLSGVVASPREITAVREVCGPGFFIATPGVRPNWASHGDQARVMTPSDAVRLGANILVIGRPITGARDRLDAANRVLVEMQSALQ